MLSLLLQLLRVVLKQKGGRAYKEFSCGFQGLRVWWIAMPSNNEGAVGGEPSSRPKDKGESKVACVDVCRWYGESEVACVDVCR